MRGVRGGPHGEAPFADVRRLAVAVIAGLLLATPPVDGRSRQTPVPAGPPATLTVQITSPLGRTGLTGPIRIVARITVVPGTTLGPVQFFVDGVLLGEDTDGPPYAREWVDDNPFLPREISVRVTNSLGQAAADTIQLKPLEIAQSTSVYSVVLEPLVLDATGRTVPNLGPADFGVTEDGVVQEVDTVVPDRLPARYTLLIDSSQSMARRMPFVQDAAAQLPQHLRAADEVVVVPFTRSLGAITGPTRDQTTIAGAVEALTPAGGTAILDCLAEVTTRFRYAEGHHILVLITDGYDEHSALAYEASLAAIKASRATVYVIAIGGVAGISLKGEDLLRRIAAETGGKAFFPARESQLPSVHSLIAGDVQSRYLIAYTPTNQAYDGAWRQVTVSTRQAGHTIRVRPGYFAPSPPPIRPQLEFTIRDLNRRYVDVSAADLVVLEDGVEQHIEGFEEAFAPVSMILAIDASGSMRRDATQVVAAARTFVEALPSKDSLGVMLFADRPLLVQDLARRRDASLDAIGQYQAAGGTALYDALADSLQRLRSVEGRRAVILLTDGRDENNPGTGPGSVRTYEDLLGLLRDVEANVFAIGLGPNVDRHRLEELAEASGGEAYFPEDVSALAADYHRILENLRLRYVISYTSTNPARDGSWRRVEVRPRRPGIVVEGRGGYHAPDR